MKPIPASFPIGRREAVKLASLGLAGALSARSARPPQTEWPVKRSGDPFGGLRVGFTTFTTRELTLEATIALLQRLDIKYISLKSFHLPLESTKAERAAVKRKIADAGLTLLGCGVIGLDSNESNIRKNLDYVRDLEAPTVVVTAPLEGLKVIDKLIKDYPGLQVAIHTHGPEDDLGYWRWSALKIMEAIRRLDHRIGCCVDVGHTFRLPLDPVTAVKACGSRLFDVHLKDLKEPSRRRLDVPLGRGVVDVRGVLRALIEMKYPYHVALEYEAEPQDPIAGVAESFGFLRGALGSV